MTETLSEALHARLDAMGAAPRETSHAALDAGLRQGETSAAPPDLAVVQGGQADTTSGLGETLQGQEMDGDTEAGQGDQQQEQTGEAPQRYKAAEFAQAIGWEPQDLYEALEVPIGDAGETLTLGEIKDKYGALTARQAEVEQAQAALQAEREQLQAAAQQQAVGGQELTDEIRAAQGKVVAIEQRYGEIPWDKLEAENPGQAANLRQKFATAYAGAKQELETANSTALEQRQAFAQNFVAQQQQRVMELVPEWKDQAVFEKENPEISQYMLGRGFTAQELPTIFHAGLRAMARDAWMWHKHQAEVAAAKGKMTRPPPRPTLRPGGPSMGSTMEREASQLEQRALDSGNAQDKLAAAKAIVRSSLQKR